MLKDTKSLGNNKAPACESRGFVHKKKVRILTHLLFATELNVKEKQVLIHQHIYEAHKGNLSYNPNNLFSQAYLSLKDVEM